jgi:hypothetical protein
MKFAYVLLKINLFTIFARTSLSKSKFSFIFLRELILCIKLTIIMNVINFGLNESSSPLRALVVSFFEYAKVFQH